MEPWNLEFCGIIHERNLNVVLQFIFQILHRLAARAVIQDWEDGSLDPDKIQHEVNIFSVFNYLIDFFLYKYIELYRDVYIIKPK